jgi:tetratricopeptide (TPR) repeat protein
MKKLIFVILFAATFNSVAQDQISKEYAIEKFNDGNAYLKLYNYEKALENYAYCNKFFVECANNTGVAYLRMGDNDTAAEWLTLAAQNGHKASVDTLKQMNRPIPKKINDSNTTTLGDVISGSLVILNAVIGGYNRGADSALRNRPRSATCTTYGNTTDCYEY